MLCQTYDDIEIIAVDDGSTDNTHEELMKFNDSRLKVYTHENKGFVKSIKEAVEIYSSGDFIAIHGSGDISLPGRIEIQANILELNPNIGVVGCYVDEENKITGEIIKRRPRWNSSLKSSCYSSRRDGSESYNDLLRNSLTKEIIESNPFTHGEVMFRRDIYIKAGGYREFFKYSQDRDLWLRMSLITDFYIVEEVLYRRFKLPGGVSVCIDKVILQKYLSNFACQCIRYKLKGEKDLLESYGEHAVFYRKREPIFAKELLFLALYAWMHGDAEKAKQINEMSIKERISTLNTLFKLLLSFTKRFQVIDKIAKKMLLFLGYGNRKFKHESK